MFLKNYKITLKILCVVVISAFIAQDISWAAQLLPSQNPIQSSGFSREDISRFNAPTEFAQIKQVHRSDKLPFLVLIEDAHSNYSGQMSLAMTLEHLIQSYGLKTVFSEGGYGDCSLDLYREAAGTALWKRVAKSQMMGGALTGEEYLNLTTEHDFKIIGMEDMDLYAKSVLMYADMAKLREASLDYLSRVQVSAATLKQKMYPRILLEMEGILGLSATQILAALKESGLNPENHQHEKKMHALLESYDVDRSSYPELQKMIALESSESQVDFDQANLEQNLLLKELSEKDQQRLQSIVPKASASVASQGAFIQEMIALASSAKIRVSAYPELLKYQSYLEKFLDIDLEIYLRERTSALDALYVAVIRKDLKDEMASKDALLLRSVDRYLGLLRTAFNIKMTSDEFASFLINEPDFSSVAYQGFLNHKLVEYGLYNQVIAYEPILDTAKASLKTFYQSVEDRDRAFISTIESYQNTSKEPVKIAAVVAGGYHTAHLTELFKQQGYSYAVLSPVVRAETNQEKYEKNLLKPFVSEVKTLKTAQGLSSHGSRDSIKDIDRQIMTARKNDGIRASLLGIINSLPETMTAEGAKVYYAEVSKQEDLLNNLGLDNKSSSYQKLMKQITSAREQINQRITSSEPSSTRVASTTPAALGSTPSKTTTVGARFAASNQTVSFDKAGITVNVSASNEAFLEDDEMEALQKNILEQVFGGDSQIQRVDEQGMEANVWKLSGAQVIDSSGNAFQGDVAIKIVGGATGNIDISRNNLSIEQNNYSRLSVDNLKYFPRQIGTIVDEEGALVAIVMEWINLPGLFDQVTQAKIDGRWDDVQKMIDAYDRFVTDLTQNELFLKDSGTDLLRVERVGQDYQIRSIDMGSYTQKPSKIFSDDHRQRLQRSLISFYLSEDKNSIYIADKIFNVESLEALTKELNGVLDAVGVSVDALRFDFEDGGIIIHSNAGDHNLKGQSMSFIYSEMERALRDFGLQPVKLTNVAYIAKPSGARFAGRDPNATIQEIFTLSLQLLSDPGKADAGTLQFLRARLDEARFELGRNSVRVSAILTILSFLENIFQVNSILNTRPQINVTRELGYAAIALDNFKLIAPDLQPAEVVSLIQVALNDIYDAAYKRVISAGSFDRPASRSLADTLLTDSEKAMIFIMSLASEDIQAAAHAAYKLWIKGDKVPEGYINANWVRRYLELRNDTNIEQFRKVRLLLIALLVRAKVATENDLTPILRTISALASDEGLQKLNRIVRQSPEPVEAPVGTRDKVEVIVQSKIDGIVGKIQNNQPVKICYICTANMNRSAIAHILTQNAITESGKANVSVVSGGLITDQLSGYDGKPLQGAPVQQQYDDALFSQGVLASSKGSFRSQQITPEKLDADLIVVASSAHKQMLLGQFPQVKGLADRIVLFTQMHPDLKRFGDEMPDPQKSELTHAELVSLIKNTVIARLFPAQSYTTTVGPAAAQTVQKQDLLFEAGTREFKLLLAAWLKAQGSTNTVRLVLESSGPISANAQLQSAVLQKLTSLTSFDQLVERVNADARKIASADFEATVAIASAGKQTDYQNAYQNIVRILQQSSFGARMAEQSPSSQEKKRNWRTRSIELLTRAYLATYKWVLYGGLVAAVLVTAYWIVSGRAEREISRFLAQRAPEEIALRARSHQLTAEMEKVMPAKVNELILIEGGTVLSTKLLGIMPDLRPGAPYDQNYYHVEANILTKEGSRETRYFMFDLDTLQTLEPAAVDEIREIAARPRVPTIELPAYVDPRVEETKKAFESALSSAESTEVQLARKGLEQIRSNALSYKASSQDYSRVFALVLRYQGTDLEGDALSALSALEPARNNDLTYQRSADGTQMLLQLMERYSQLLTQENSDELRNKYTWAIKRTAERTFVTEDQYQPISDRISELRLQEPNSSYQYALEQAVSGLSSQKSDGARMAKSEFPTPRSISLRLTKNADKIKGKTYPTVFRAIFPDIALTAANYQKFLQYLELKQDASDKYQIRAPARKFQFDPDPEAIISVDAPASALADSEADLTSTDLVMPTLADVSANLSNIYSLLKSAKTEDEALELAVAIEDILKGTHMTDDLRRAEIDRATQELDLRIATLNLNKASSLITSGAELVDSDEALARFKAARGMIYDAQDHAAMHALDVYVQLYESAVFWIENMMLKVYSQTNRKRVPSDQAIGLRYKINRFTEFLASDPSGMSAVKEQKVLPGMTRLYAVRDELERNTVEAKADSAKKAPTRLTSVTKIYFTKPALKDAENQMQIPDFVAKFNDLVRSFANGRIDVGDAKHTQWKGIRSIRFAGDSYRVYWKVVGRDVVILGIYHKDQTESKSSSGYKALVGLAKASFEALNKASDRNVDEFFKDQMHIEFVYSGARMAQSSDERPLVRHSALSVPSDLKVAIFDWDGTISDMLSGLIDVQAKIIASVLTSKQESQLSPEEIAVGRKFYYDTLGMTDVMRFQKAIDAVPSAAVSLSAEQINQTYSIAADRYVEDNIDKWKQDATHWVPGALELAREFKQRGVKVYVATANALLVKHNIVERLGLADLFEAVLGVGSNQVPDFSKTKAVRWIIENNSDVKNPSGQVVMIGDGAGDIKAAKENSVYSIALIRSPDQNDALMSANPDASIGIDFGSDAKVLADAFGARFAESVYDPNTPENVAYLKSMRDRLGANNPVYLQLKRVFDDKKIMVVHQSVQKALAEHPEIMDVGTVVDTAILTRELVMGLNFEGGEYPTGIKTAVIYNSYGFDESMYAAYVHELVEAELVEAFFARNREQPVVAEGLYQELVNTNYSDIAVDVQMFLRADDYQLNAQEKAEIAHDILTLFSQVALRPQYLLTIRSILGASTPAYLHFEAMFQAFNKNINDRLMVITAAHLNQKRRDGQYDQNFIQILDEAVRSLLREAGEVESSPLSQAYVRQWRRSIADTYTLDSASASSRALALSRRLSDRKFKSPIKQILLSNPALGRWVAAIKPSISLEEFFGFLAWQDNDPSVKISLKALNAQRKEVHSLIQQLDGARFATSVDDFYAETQTGLINDFREIIEGLPQEQGQISSVGTLEDQTHNLKINRIVFFTPWFLVTSGVMTYQRTIVASLLKANQGLTIDIVYPTRTNAEVAPIILEDTVRGNRLIFRGIAGVDEDGDVDQGTFSENFAQTLGAIKTENGGHIDLIVNNSPEWLQASEKLLGFADDNGVATLAYAHGGDRLDQKAVGMMKRHTLAATNSQFMQGEISRISQLPESDFSARVVPYTADLDFHNPASLTTEDEDQIQAMIDRYGLEGKHVIIHPGRISPEKGQDITIAAAKKIVDTQSDKDKYVFLMIGPDSVGITLNLQDQINGQGLQDYVKIVGPQSWHEMRRWYAIAARQGVVIYPSVWQEPFGLVPVEAQAAGAAVIATNSGGLPETLQDGKTGILIEPYDFKTYDETRAVDSLAEAITTISGDESRRLAMGREGMAYVTAKFGKDADGFARAFLDAVIAKTPAGMTVGARFATSFEGDKITEQVIQLGLSSRFKITVEPNIVRLYQVNERGEFLKLVATYQGSATQLTIGRNSGNHLILSSTDFPGVSGEHAVININLDEGKLQIRDGSLAGAQSRNGTFVAGQKIESGVVDIPFVNPPSIAFEGQYVTQQLITLAAKAPTERALQVRISWDNEGNVYLYKVNDAGFAVKKIAQANFGAQSSLDIGRNQDAKLSIDNTVISGRHAQLLRAGQYLYIRDGVAPGQNTPKASTNGTAVDGTEIDDEYIRLNAITTELESDSRIRAFIETALADGDLSKLVEDIESYGPFFEVYSAEDFPASDQLTEAWDRVKRTAQEIIRLRRAHLEPVNAANIAKKDRDSKEQGLAQLLEFIESLRSLTSDEKLRELDAQELEEIREHIKAFSRFNQGPLRDNPDHRRALEQIQTQLTTHIDRLMFVSYSGKLGDIDVQRFETPTPDARALLAKLNAWYYSQSSAQKNQAVTAKVHESSAGKALPGFVDLRDLEHQDVSQEVGEIIEILESAEFQRDLLAVANRPVAGDVFDLTTGVQIEVRSVDKGQIEIMILSNNLIQTISRSEFRKIVKAKYSIAQSSSDGARFAQANPKIGRFTLSGQRQIVLIYDPDLKQITVSLGVGNGTATILLDELKNGNVVTLGRLENTVDIDSASDKRTRQIQIPNSDTFISRRHVQLSMNTQGQVVLTNLSENLVWDSQSQPIQKKGSVNLFTIPLAQTSQLSNSEIIAENLRDILETRLGEVFHEFIRRNPSDDPQLFLVLNTKTKRVYGFYPSLANIDFRELQQVSQDELMAIPLQLRNVDGSVQVLHRSPMASKAYRQDASWKGFIDEILQQATKQMLTSENSMLLDSSLLNAGSFDGKVQQLTEAERASLKSSIEIHGDRILEKRLSIEDLERLDMLPKHKFIVNGTEVFVAASIYQLSEKRQATIVYVPVVENGKTIYVARTYYISASSANWRYLPSVWVDDKKDTGAKWYDKGYDEQSVTAPFEYQWALDHLLRTSGVLPLNHFADGDRKLLFLGPTRDLTNPYLYLRAGQQVTSDVDSRFGMPAEHSYVGNKGVDSQPDILAPGALKRDSVLASPDNVDISDHIHKDLDPDQKIVEYELTQGPYKGWWKRVFLSQDKKVIFVVVDNIAPGLTTLDASHVRGFVASVEKVGEIGAAGLRRKWADVGALVTPIREYPSQAGFYGGKDAGDGYVDMWENYISQFPFMRRYFQSVHNISLPRRSVFERPAQPASSIQPGVHTDSPPTSVSDLNDAQRRVLMDELSAWKTQQDARYVPGNKMFLLRNALVAQVIELIEAQLEGHVIFIMPGTSIERTVEARRIRLANIMGRVKSTLDLAEEDARDGSSEQAWVDLALNNVSENTGLLLEDIAPGLKIIATDIQAKVDVITSGARFAQNQAGVAVQFSRSHGRLATQTITPEQARSSTTLESALALLYLRSQIKGTLALLSPELDANGAFSFAQTTDGRKVAYLHDSSSGVPGEVLEAVEIDITNEVEALRDSGGVAMTQANVSEAVAESQEAADFISEARKTIQFTRSFVREHALEAKNVTLVFADYPVEFQELLQKQASIAQRLTGVNISLQFVQVGEVQSAIAGDKNTVVFAEGADNALKNALSSNAKAGYANVQTPQLKNDRMESAKYLPIFVLASIFSGMDVTSNAYNEFTADSRIEQLLRVAFNNAELSHDNRMAVTGVLASASANSSLLDKVINSLKIPRIVSLTKTLALNALEALQRSVGAAA